MTSRRVVLSGAILLTAAAAVATFTSASGSLVADARYEHFAEPAQFLARHASVWDGERNLGEPAQYFSPATATFQTVLAWLGAAPWVIQRLTHTLLLAAAGVGTMLLLERLFRDSWVGVVGAFLYVFNPYTSQYLVPSGLFTAYAVAPWLVLAAIRGADGRDRWRWAAAFALAAFVVGLLNTPALILASIPVVVIAPAYVRQSEDASWAALAGWAWRAVALSAAVSAAMIVVLVLALPEFRANIETTESALVPPRTSSASESWRGLGFWLSYLWIGGRPLREQATAYFTNPGVIAATYAAPAVAGLALWRRDRPHLAGFAILAGLSIILMTGVHPVEDPAPIGSALRWLFEESTAARGFRSTYKAGAGLQLALAALGAVAAVGAVRSASTRPTGATRLFSASAAALVVVAVTVGAFPFWTGSLYDGDEQFDEVPDYWKEAFAWFDQQPSEPGVLVLPSASRSRYRWGFVNDGLFEAHLAQPAVVPQTLPQSTGVLADLTEAVDEYLRAGSYRSGSLAPILESMGVRWIVVQNDLTWERSGLPRPSVFDPVRADPDFELAASFGTAGRNVVPPTGLAPAFDGERRLPPVEVYELVAPRAAGAYVADTTLLMTGGGEAWPSMATDGLLSWPIVYTADLDEAELLAAPSHSIALVVSDGGQRRATQSLDQAAAHSHVLRVDEDVGRPARPLFPRAADQTVAVYADLAAVDASSFGSLFAVWPSQYRPANALDGLPETAWATDRLSGVPALRVELARPTDVVSLVVTTAAERPEAARVAGLRIRASSAAGDPTVIEVDAEPAGTSFDIPVVADGVTSLSFELEVEGSARASLVGIAELVVLTEDGSLDTREFLRAPAPVTGASGVEGLVGLPVHYRFTRSPGGGPGAEQAHVWREFWSPGQDGLVVTADVRIDDQTPDRVIDALLGAPVGAYATRRAEDGVEGTASGVLDDDPTTAWRIDAARPGELTVRLGVGPVDQIELRSIVVGSAPVRNDRVSQLEIVITDAEGTTTVPVTLPTEAECDPNPALIEQDLCLERVVVDIEPVAAETVIIRPLVVDEVGGPLGGSPAAIDAVQVRYRGVDLVDEVTTAPDDGCRAVFWLDGAPLEMRPTSDVSIADLWAGVRLESCEPLTLDPGWHRLATIDAVPYSVNTVSIDPRATMGSPTLRSVAVQRVSQTDHRLSTRVERGELIVTDIAAHDGWEVTARGVDGDATVANGFVAWRASGSGEVELKIVFGPQRTYRVAWLVTAAALAACIWLLLPRRRKKEG